MIRVYMDLDADKIESIYEIASYVRYNYDKCVKKVERTFAVELPCEDAVSRQAVLEQTYNWSKDEFLRVTNPFDYLRKRINSLPSVRPQEKTGHWILADSQDNVDVENGNNRYICSECTFSDIHAKSTEVPYCWHCGARMESEI